MSAPLVTAQYPAPLATGVPTNVQVTATFDQIMDATTINETTFILVEDGTLGSTITGDVDYDYTWRRAEFSPTYYLDEYTTYKAILIASVIKSVGGEYVSGSTIQWTFTTGGEAAATGSESDPIVTGITVTLGGDIPASSYQEELAIDYTYPANGDYKIAQDTAIDIYFTDDLWLEDTDTVILGAGAYSDPTGWIEDNITIEVEPVLGDESAGFTPNSPTFSATYDADENKITLAPTSSGYVGSYYVNGYYIAGTETANNWEPMCDYVVTLKKNKFRGLDTAILDNDYSFYFTTVLTPMYISVNEIMGTFGGAFASVPENTIAFLIHRNSLRAQMLGTITSPVQRYVKDYVYCKTILDLINSMYVSTAAGGIGKRSLGDMSISKSSSDIEGLVGPVRGDITACVKYNEGLIRTGGQGTGPRYAVPHRYESNLPGQDSTWKRIDKIDDAKEYIQRPATAKVVGRNTYPFIRRRS